MFRHPPRSTLFPYDALPIFDAPRRGLTGRARKLGAKLGLLDPAPGKAPLPEGARRAAVTTHLDRKSTRLNSSHTVISYAVFCLKKKKKKRTKRVQQNRSTNC